MPAKGGRTDTRRVAYRGGGKITGFRYTKSGLAVMTVTHVYPRVIGSHHGEYKDSEGYGTPGHSRNRKRY